MHYRCTHAARFEKIQHFTSKPESVCRECGGELERPLTAPRLHFKGAGFYVTTTQARVKTSSEPLRPRLKPRAAEAVARPCPPSAAAIYWLQTAQSPKKLER